LWNSDVDWVDDMARFAQQHEQHRAANLRATFTRSTSFMHAVK
jgi:hypothetical protein